MLTDGITQEQGAGEGEGVQIQDVSQMLLAAVKRGDPARRRPRRHRADRAPPTAPLIPTARTALWGRR